MRSIQRVVFVALLCSVGVTFSLPEDVERPYYENVKELLAQREHNSTLEALFDEHFKFWNTLDTLPNLPKFDCEPEVGMRSADRPTSVHQLRPGDIDVVAALGDSITASCGLKAKTAVGILLEWRGLSWSMGGDGSVDSNVFTIPNMLKKFNPNLIGASHGIIPLLSQNLFPKKVNLNMAVSGAKSKNIMAQAEKLVERMRNNKQINFEKDWKLVTLFIGGNDICAFCKNETEYSASMYQSNIGATLEYLRENLPNTLVNVVPMLDVTQLSEVNDGLVCNILHRLECKCGSFPKNDVAKQKMIEEGVEYANSILDLLATNSFDKGDNFTVVAQPFLINQRLPTDKDGKPDIGFFAPDCFHFSGRGHAAAAQGLWNNMFEPAGKKRLSWFTREGWKCPTRDNPFIFTYRNSGYVQTGSGGLVQTESGGPVQTESGGLGQTASGGLGGQQSVPNLLSDDMKNFDSTKSQKETTSTLTGVAAPLIGGVCIGAAMVVIAVLVVKVLRRKPSNRAERTRLL